MLATKLSEPVTLITDGAIGVQCLIFSIILFKSLKISRDPAILKMWIGCFLSLSIFAFAGSISHGTPSLTLYSNTWPVCVTFGGVALYFLHIAMMMFYGKKNGESDINQKPHPMVYIIPTTLLIVYLIVLPGSGWSFAYFGYYFIVIALHFFGLFFVNRNVAAKQPFGKILFMYVAVFMIFGVIQILGKTYDWAYTFGSSDQYLFQLGNEIFHIGILYPNWLFYQGICKNFGIPEISN